MAIVDVENVKSILAHCAEEYVLPRYKALEDHEINTKSGPQDLVTQADIDVEAHLERVLPDLLPGSIVVGEEGVSRGEASLEALHDTSRPVWVVDPVDGTHNFVHHEREFGIMLACVIDGVTEYGFIYDVLGEKTAVAERGSGAYFGDERLNVDQTASTPVDMAGHINHKFFPKEYRQHIQDAEKHFKECSSLHCAAHEYLGIARGDKHFVIYSRLKPWDHLPGALLVEEAGGYIAKWDKQPYTPKDTYAGLIVTTDDANWDKLYDIFFSALDISAYL